MLTCAKALSASYLPISALMISEGIYQAMRSQSEKIGVFGHGFTYGGHPVPAAVALECLNIYEERRLPEHTAQVGDRLGAGLRRLAEHPLVGEVRGEGLMWGVELVADKATKAAFPREWKVGLAASQQTEANGVTARSLNDSVVFAPPKAWTPPSTNLSRSRDSTIEPGRTTQNNEALMNELPNR
jgi:4-aminobutyrate--pyruvate transaminase